MGRLVVHDRIQVEATVLPRYFNHSSFASLRRQLNYFSFVRLGKGRQRESTYINEGVIALDDILALRRRSAGAATGGGQAPHQHQHQDALTQGKGTLGHKERLESTPSLPKTYVESIVPVVHLPSSRSSPKSTAAKRAKRAKQVKKKLNLPLVNAPFVSEDEESQGKGPQGSGGGVALDLTQPQTDPELLEGCTALLGLSGKLWG